MPFIGNQPAEVALTSGDLGDDIVTEAKIANDAIGLTELKAGTDGELITWDASGNPAAVAVGTSTHVLTSNGAGAAPTFQAPAGGNVELITHTVCSSDTTVSFTGLDTHTDAAMFQIDFIFHPSVNNTYFDILFGTGSGPTYATSGYTWNNWGVSSGSGSRQLQGTSAASMHVAELQSTNKLGTDTGEGLQGSLFFIPAVGDNRSRIFGAYAGVGEDNYGCWGGNFAGGDTSVSTITALQFGLTTAGTFVSGFFSLKKYKNA